MKTRVTCTIDPELMDRVRLLQRVYYINVSQILEKALQAEADRLHGLGYKIFVRTEITGQLKGQVS